MCSRCWMTSSQVGLQASERMEITPYAGGRDILNSTMADALPACCVPESSTARLQMTQCGAKHGAATTVSLKILLHVYRRPITGAVVSSTPGPSWRARPVHNLPQVHDGITAA